MAIACVCIPRFPLALALRARPDLAGMAVVIGGQAEDRGRVVSASPEAEDFGIVPGIPLRKALGLCKDAVFLPANPAHDEREAERFLALLEMVSPAVEPSEFGCAFVDARGITTAELGAAVERTFGLTPKVGIAPGKFTARVVALQGGDPRVLAPREAQAFLAPQPVSLLPMSREMQRRLTLFGIRTLGELAALPLGPVQAQFGPEGRRAWALARGDDRAPLAPRKPVLTITERLTLESPTASSGTRLLGVQRLLDRAFSQPAVRYRAVRRVSLALHCEEQQSLTQTVTLQEPSSEQSRIVLVLRSYLERVALPAAVEEMALTLHNLTGETGRQGSLFVDRGRLQAQVNAAVRQLIARYGYSPIFMVEEVEPWSRFPEHRAALVEYVP